MLLELINDLLLATSTWLFCIIFAWTAWATFTIFTTIAFTTILTAITTFAITTLTRRITWFYFACTTTTAFTIITAITLATILATITTFTIATTLTSWYFSTTSSIGLFATWIHLYRFDFGFNDIWLNKDLEVDFRRDSIKVD